jgi:hypothetical protein
VAALQSKKLSDLLADKERLLPKTKEFRAEVFRLTQLQNPSVHTETVRRIADYSDAKDKAAKAGVITTGTDSESAESARKADALQRTLDGVPLEDEGSIKDKLDKTNRSWASHEDAIEFRDREIFAEREFLAKEYCKKITPQHDQSMVKLGKATLDFYAAWIEANELRQHLIDEAVGLRRICLTLPDFLSNPLNKHSDFAGWIRAMAKQGFISSTPKQLRLI